MKLSTLMEDNSGGFSATRLAFLLWIVGLLIIWLVSSAKTGSIQDIPQSVLTLVGILMGGKVVQRFGERADDATAQEDAAQSGVPALNPAPPSASPPLAQPSQA